MKKISINLIVLMICAVFMSNFAGHSFAADEIVAEQKQKEQFEDSKVSIDVFIVTANLETLYDLGAEPIAVEAKPVTVAHIEKCLKKKDKARILGAAKLLVRNKNRGEVRSEELKYWPSKTGKMTKDGKKINGSQKLNSFRDSTRLEGMANIKSATKIQLELAFSQDTFDFTHATEKIPPVKFDFSWQSVVVLKPGEQRIVSATQGEKFGTFLIVSTDIVEQDLQKAR